MPEHAAPVDPLDDHSVDSALQAALAALDEATDLDALAAARTAQVGDRSPLALARAAIGALPSEVRKDAGRRVNVALGRLTSALATRQGELEAARDERVLVEERADVTLPHARRPVGARHPLTTLAELVVDVFVAMGYEQVEGPEVETEWHNFDALNLGPDHPARAMQDTIYLDPPGDGVLLRTHTSNAQIRTLLQRTPPVYVVSPGRVFRNDALDATHSPVFHQVECLAVDEGLTMAHLRGTIDAFARGMFGDGLRSRLRPSYFPFVEPGAEVDFECFACRGVDDACRVCSGEGWIEWGGAGMVHPNVLRACGVDPERYSGFAFGMGLDRTLMMRHDVRDLRDLFDGDVRFTLPFGSEA